MRTFVLALILGVAVGCGGEQSVTNQEEIGPDQNTDEPSVYEDHCGNRVCEENKGEDYWNCLDCVDFLTGGPKHGYCGDGICFNETMLSCFKDCRPRPYNSGGDDDPIPGNSVPPIPSPGPIPIPGTKPEPIPGPGPGPMPVLKPSLIP